MNKPSKYERPIVRKLSMVTQSSTGGKLGRGLFPFQVRDPKSPNQSTPLKLSDTDSITLKTLSDVTDNQQI